MRNAYVIPLVVLVVQNVPSDLDQERVKYAVVPLVKLLSHLLLGHSELQHQVVRLANQLHVTVLDSVPS